jgi:predicted dehydrogenase
MENKANKEKTQVSRRDFLKTSAVAGVAAVLAGSPRIYAAGSDTIKVGLIGCGGRGAGAASNCLLSSPNVELVAMGDMFSDRIEKALTNLRDGAQYIDKVPQEKIKVTPETKFTGFDAYKKVIAGDANLVILTTPPHFRPMHLKAAIEAGKNVFMEKPVATDPVGIRSVIASSDLADQKKLAIVAGTQRRHQAQYLEIMKRIANGDIGELVGGQCYWMQECVRRWGFFNPRQPGWTDMEWQLRNWYFFTWLSGDIIVEQHVHNIDVMSWAFGAHPVKAIGMGGRQVRVEPEFGNIYDHFAVEFEYPNGARIQSMSRQIDGCSDRVSEHVVGTKGKSDMSAISGLNPYRYKGENPNPYVVEHTDLIKSIREGTPLNEGKRVAESTMTAIMGRMSAYTGRELSWDWVMNSSKLDLTPARYELGDMPVEPVAMPGVTKLV